MRRAELALMVAVLGVTAWLSPQPWWQTDRDVYERMGREWVVPGCNDFHCFRPLVSWMLGRIPGPSLVIWKTYAVLCEAGAAVAMFHWARRWNSSVSSARMVAWLTALGSGPCYTLFDPFTSDPLMHLLGPTLMLAIDRGNVGFATAASAIGVFAKEFAAVPLAISAATRGLQERWPEMRRLTVLSAVVVMVWAAWQLIARTQLHYTTGPTYSADVTTGGYLVFWLLTLSTTLVITLITMVLGGLWLLWPAGLYWGPRDLRQLTFASVPALLVFNALQQPDRALWNFAFLVMPAVAIVLDRVPASLGWILVAAQGFLNVRFGAQLSQAPPARLSLAAAAIVAAAIVWRARSVSIPGVEAA
ncbi:MAG TPA: hypothetical protein VM096_14715 [Vicinamibacterales bacterium]|nr:hypothetical protein [Vicinamibacterales bacterium]